MTTLQQSRPSLPGFRFGGSHRLMERALLGLLMAAAAIPALADAPAAVGGSTDSELIRRATWEMPSWENVRGAARSWIESRADARPDPARLERARSLWPAVEPFDDPTTDRLDRFAATMALLAPQAASLVAASDRPETADMAWLKEQASAEDPQLHAVMSLFHGRQLVRHGFFDEGRGLLKDLPVETACDPASLLFHRAACEHWLLDPEAGLATLDRLLEQASVIPVRYERLARLMRSDLQALEDESLDHIARRMRDITRRLDLGQAGPRTQSVQEGVIESLDKLIAKIEEQQQQQNESGGAGSGAGGSGGSRPMEDSQIAGGKGPGEVARKDLEDGGEWGDLPPHEREEALQQIAREFPPHYREVIEHYFKRLASGDESP